MQEVTITIEDGVAEIKVKGIKGRKCLEATKDLEKALGAVQEQELTSELYEAQQRTTASH